MVITTKVGQSGWAIIVSSAKTGAAGSETPDGDVYYFNCNISGKLKPLDKFTPASTFVSRYPTTKVEIQIKAENCVVPAVIAASSTQELDLILDFIYNSSIKTGADKVYLFVRHEAESRYLKLSWSATHVHQQFLLGQFFDSDYKLIGGDYIWKLNFVFKQATLP